MVDVNEVTRKDSRRTARGGVFRAFSRQTPGAEADTPFGAGWVAVCRQDSLLEGRGRSFVVAGLSLAVFLVEGRVFAVRNQCPHRDVPLDDGLVDQGCVTCTWHNWRFDLRTGEHITTFGRRHGVPTYPVRIADNTVWVDSKLQLA